MKTYEEWRSVSRPGRLSPGDGAPGTHWMGDWVDSEVGSEAVENRKISSSC
jgi:hypothetical protein